MIEIKINLVNEGGKEFYEPEIKTTEKKINKQTASVLLAFLLSGILGDLFIYNIEELLDADEEDLEWIISNAENYVEVIKPTKKHNAEITPEEMIKMASTPVISPIKGNL